MFSELSEEEIREKFFSTSNTNLCAFLLSHNFMYIEAKRYKGSVIFYFDKSKKLDNCINTFFANKELKKYLDCIQTIRSRLKLID